jgi:GTP-binding protein
MLTNKKQLAKVSHTPGKTKLLNYFKIDDTWYLVDLPGYGYAKVSQSARSGFDKMIRAYLTNRINLSCVFVLIDCQNPTSKSRFGVFKLARRNAGAICFGVH